MKVIGPMSSLGTESGKAYGEFCSSPHCRKRAVTRDHCARHYQQNQQIRRYGRLTPEREYCNPQQSVSVVHQVAINCTCQKGIVPVTTNRCAAMVDSPLIGKRTDLPRPLPR